MKNYEKYENEIRKYNGNEFCVDFVQPYILKENGCASINCEACFMYQMIWLLKDYEEIKEPKKPKEPKIDWGKVEVDTPILVRATEKGEWIRRHFAKYDNTLVYAWKDSRTSWTSLYDDEVTAWKYAKLAEDEEKPKIDWTKVKVDTPILVRDNKDSKWLKRYFAKYEDGLVYAWLGENTSYDTCNAAKWKYAKLAESEEE